MESFEISGKTVDEALQKAEKKLGVSRDEINYTIIKEGKSGILGIGSEEARIMIEPMTPTEEPDNITKIAKSILSELLNRLGFNIEASLEEPLVAEENDTNKTITFNITGDDDVGILIGRHGQTMSSLQYLVRVILAKKITNPPSVILDVDGYKRRRYDALRATAKRLAEQVKLRKTPFTFEPMPAYERRIIHLALVNDQNVITQSIGENESRKVVILPKNMNKTRTINNR